MTPPREARLFNVSDVRVSTVDKHTNEGEQAVRLCNYVDVYKNEVILNNFDFMPATCTPDEIARFRLTPGDVVFTKDSETADDIGIPAFVKTSAPDLVCGYHVAIATPHQDLVDPKFLFWYLNSRPAFAWWETRASGVTRMGLRQEDIRHLRLGVLPPLAHQQTIADFLDRETAQIDAMIDAQADVVRLAQEHRGAVVAEEMTVVSAGGAPAVPLRYCLTVQSGVTLGKQFGEDAIEYPYLRVANVQAGYLNLDEIKTIRVSADVAASSTLRAGDVLITEGGDRAALGRGALWRGEIPNALHQNHIFALRCGGLLDPEFLVYVLDAPAARIYFESTRRQTTNLSSTNSGKVKAFKTPLPPIMKQREIVVRLNEALVRVDEVIASAQRVIELLRERREALITAAVTGRIDPTTGIERIDQKTEEEAS